MSFQFIIEFDFIYVSNTEIEISVATTINSYFNENTTDSERLDQITCCE